MSRADCIISGLPFALFPHKMQKRIMNAVYEALCGDNCGVGGGSLADGGFAAGGGRYKCNEARILARILRIFNRKITRKTARKAA